MSALVRHVPADVVDRLAKVAGLLGSDHDGERSAAAFRASTILHAAGLTWRELVEAAGPRSVERKPERQHDAAGTWYDRTHACLYSRAALTDWERKFLLSLASRGPGRRPSEKQLAILAEIYAKVRGS